MVLFNRNDKKTTICLNTGPIRVGFTGVNMDGQMTRNSSLTFEGQEFAPDYWPFGLFWQHTRNIGSIKIPVMFMNKIQNNHFMEVKGRVRFALCSICNT